jgi:uncharacterized membrane protein
MLTDEQKSQVVQAIKLAEKQTSGEIKVHIESQTGIELMARAAEVFTHLELHKTEQRNGVLIYWAMVDRKFAIVGDKGINAVVPADFWKTTRDTIQSNFVMNQFVAGLTEGIAIAGEALKKYFPYQSDDVNEISDDISFGD